MVKPAWGMKRTCQGCAARFYDLQKSPIICPKCATVYDPDAGSRTRRSRSSPAVAKPVPRPPVPELAEVPAEIAPDIEEAEIGIAEDEGVIEDTEDLPEDEADVTEVVENVEEEEP